MEFLGQMWPRKSHLSRRWMHATLTNNAHVEHPFQAIRLRLERLRTRLDVFRISKNTLFYMLMQDVPIL